MGEVESVTDEAGGKTICVYETGGHLKEIQMLKEYDIVKARRDLSGKILKGCTGVIVMAFQSSDLAYEIEFVNDKGDTIEVITAYPDDIEVSDK